MRLYFHKKWSNFVDYQNPTKGIFVGRPEEVNKLKSYIMNNNGSIIVSGIRGVGKTSFVYKVIQEVEKESKSEDKKLIPIIVNASQLNIKKETFFEDILHNLIRRVYSVLKDENIEELESIYKKIQGKYEKSEEVRQVNQESQSDKRRNETKFQLSKSLDPTLLKMITAIFGSSFVFLAESELMTLIGVLLLVIPTVSIVYAKERIKEVISSKTNQHDAKELYQYDNSLSNIEFEFQQLLEKLNKFKIVFVIDELDKLQTLSQDNKLKSKQFIMAYKNLFTLSEANYIFITDQKDYEELITADKKEEPLPTLFSYRLFLSEPNYSELKTYFKEIIADQRNSDGERINKISNQDQKLIEDMEDFIIYECQNNFFEVKNYILSEIEYDDQNEPYIDLENFFFNKNKTTIKLKSAILKIVDQVYLVDKYSSLDKQYENKNNLELLFKISELLLSGESYDYSIEDKFIKENSATMDGDLTDDTNNGHIQNLLETLTRCGILSVTENSAFRTYRITNKIPKEIKNINEYKSANEENFIKIFEEFINLVNEIDDISLGNNLNRDKIYADNDVSSITDTNNHEIYVKFKPYYDQLIRKVPRHIQTEHLDSYTKELQTNCELLKTNVLSIFSKTILEWLINKDYKQTDIKKANDPLILNQIPSLKSILTSLPHNIITVNNNSKQIVITENFELESVDDDALRVITEEQDKSIFLLNIVTKDRILMPDFKFSVKVESGKDKEGNPKYKQKNLTLRKNFQEVKFSDSYRAFENVLKVIDKWIKNSSE